MSEHRDPVRIEADIEQTRERMAETLDALQHKLSPGKALDEVLGFLQGRGGDTGRIAQDSMHSVGEMVRNNPVPMSLIGLGLGWMLLSGNRRSDDGRTYRGYHDDDYQARYRHALDTRTGAGGPQVATGGYRRHDAAAGVGGNGNDSASRDSSATAAGQQTAAGRGRETLDSAKAGLHGAADRVRDGAAEARRHLHDTADRVRESATDAGRQVYYQGQRVRGQAERLIDDQPMVLIGAGLALGALLGAVLPGTRREDRLMGETRDELVAEAVAAGSEQLQKAHAVAEAAVDAAAESAAEAAKDENERQTKASASAAGR